MKAFTLLKIICRVILPFIILFGLFIIINGDISPGGGFQGGVVLGSAFLVVYFINENKPIPFSSFIRMEKRLFILLILSCIAFMTLYQPVRSVMDTSVFQLVTVICMMYLNLLIGFKVSIGICGIMVIFIEEGNP